MGSVSGVEEESLLLNVDKEAEEEAEEDNADELLIEPIVVRKGEGIATSIIMPNISKTLNR